MKLLMNVTVLTKKIWQCAVSDIVPVVLLRAAAAVLSSDCNLKARGLLVKKPALSRHSGG